MNPSRKDSIQNVVFLVVLLLFAAVFAVNERYWFMAGVLLLAVVVGVRWSLKRRHGMGRPE